MAGGLGFEPRLTESESAILPLDDPPSYTHRERGGTEANHNKSNYRLENCGPLRALWRPTFLRSTIRASLVNNPAVRNNL